MSLYLWRELKYININFQFSYYKKEINTPFFSGKEQDAKKMYRNLKTLNKYIYLKSDHKDGWSQTMIKIPVKKEDSKLELKMLSDAVSRQLGSLILILNILLALLLPGVWAQVSSICSSLIT